ncbi:hypothetical protein BDA96_02G316400 [Sorghum bicolor]|uniref:Uncharacterized protein n=1 Tax=Sorghum bicolor TaxID=4558 RepID=A0A921UX36_SORBI|nr:hypothetical protein BDA96_02G316400 [Sorghum bicolor]
MASGSSSRARGSGARGSSSRARAAQAPSADDALLVPQLNPMFVAMPAADLVAYLNQHRRTDNFVDAALVFASRERRLTEAEERIDSLLHEIRARDHSALEAEDKIRRAAETEAALRAKIRTLQLGAAALISSGISGGGGGGGLAQQAAAAGHGREEPVPQDFITASDDSVGFDDATGVVQTTVAQGEVGDDVPMKMRHGALNRAAPHHLAAAPVPSAAAALISSGISGRGLTQEAAGLGREPVPQDFITASDDGVGSDAATGVQTMFAQRKVGDDVPMKMMHGALSRAAPHLVAAPLPRAPPHLAAAPLPRAPPHLVAAPLPDTLIDDDKRAAEQVAANIASKYEVAQGDHKVSEDVLRASTTAPAVPDRPDESPEAEDGGSNRAASEAGPRLKRKRQARPNKRFAGPEWDV